MTDKDCIKHQLLKALSCNQFLTSSEAWGKLTVSCTKLEVSKIMLELHEEGKVSHRRTGKKRPYIYWVDLINIEPVPESARVRCDPVIGSDVSYSAWGHFRQVLFKAQYKVLAPAAFVFGVGIMAVFDMIVNAISG